ncbi:hypothetical protein BS78_06G058900 [Paspalum vaginatum]|nr:hypothetical protein BS78_06G058900 [Paspalum vaginatum]
MTLQSVQPCPLVAQHRPAASPPEPLSAAASAPLHKLLPAHRRRRTACRGSRVSFSLPRLQRELLPATAPVLSANVSDCSPPHRPCPLPVLPCPPAALRRPAKPPCRQQPRRSGRPPQPLLYGWRMQNQPQQPRSRSPQPRSGSPRP